MSIGTLQAVVPVRNVLGEGVQWNTSDECVWWTDIPARQLCRMRLTNLEVERIAMPERVGSFAFVQDDERMIVAFETGVALYDPQTRAIEWIERLESPGSGRRFNDGRADRQARFWTGTMVEDTERADAHSAHLYCVERKQLHERVSGIGISNGICFSPDSRYMYFADSRERTIWRYDFDAPTGTLGRRIVFARTPQGASPDGAAVDAGGCVWSAQWGAARVVRYAPTGKIDGYLEIPARQPSCVAFGGPHFDTIFVTTASQGVPGTSAEDSAAGHLFVFRTTLVGLPESRYRA